MPRFGRARKCGSNLRVWDVISGFGGNDTIDDMFRRWRAAQRICDAPCGIANYDAVPILPAKEILAMPTINAARLLRLDHLGGYRLACCT